jgi:hypothetical protein
MLNESNPSGRTHMALRGERVLQATSCLLSLIAARASSSGLEGTEFSRGRVTAALLYLSDTGIVLLAAALLLTFAYSRIGAALGILGSVLCVPLYVYFIAPGAFRNLFPGKYSVPLETNFVWSSWPIIGMIALAVALVLCGRNLSSSRYSRTT